MKHSAKLHKKLYSIYKEKGLTETRRDIVYQFTNGRTDNSSELTTPEILELINTLEKESKTEHTKQKPPPKTINKLFSLCYLYGWKKFDNDRNRFVVDTDSLNAWLTKYGKFHKVLKDHSVYELGVVTSQFEKVVNQLLKSL